MYSILMALDDVLNDGQAHQTTQHYETFTQPPGAATTGLHSLTRPRQAEFSLEDFLLPEHLEAGVRHTTRMPTTFSIDGQSSGSEVGVYKPSPADPTLPLPPPTRALKLRPSFFRSRHSSTSHSTPSAGVTFLSQGRPSSHSRVLSQPCLMPQTQTVLGRGCGPADAASSSYASVPELNLKSTSEPAQSRLLPVSLDTSLITPPTFPTQEPEPTPWNFTRLFSRADASHAENSQNPIRTSHAQENQSTQPAAYSPFPDPGSSPAIPSTRFLTPGLTDMIPEPSYHAQDDPLAFLNPPSSSGIDMVTAMTFAGRASPDALSQLTGHDPAQQATPPASPESQPEQQRLAGKRRRLSEPKDPKAAKRLRSQRQGDEENLEALYKLLVPSGAGAVQKKDRLGIILHHARKLMKTQGSSKQHSMISGNTRGFLSSPQGGFIERP